MNEQLIFLRKQLQKRSFEVYLCADKHEAFDTIIKIIQDTGRKNLFIGVGGSETIKALNLADKLADFSKNIHQHIPGSAEDSDRQVALSDIYFTSANAISSDGYIVNIDGTGNRTAATCFGPKQVIFVIGKNKICATLDDAIERAQNVAAVSIAKKYKMNTPCVQTGKCENCQSPQCVCRVMTIHRKQLYGNKTTIILIDENLGI